VPSDAGGNRSGERLAMALLAVGRLPRQVT
jgi:hypothetical protein